MSLRLPTGRLFICPLPKMRLPMFLQRWICFALVGACAALMLIALYMEHGLGLEPCPLCMMQRLAIMAVGALALLAGLHAPRQGGLRVYGGLLVLAAASGAGLAVRQVWLQSLPPDRVPACGPGLEYMLDVFPLLDVLAYAVQGTGDCAKVDWTFLGLSIAGWNVPIFIGMSLLGLFLVWRPRA